MPVLSTHSQALGKGVAGVACVARAIEFRAIEFSAPTQDVELVEVSVPVIIHLAILVYLNPTVPKFPDSFTLKSTRLARSHLANTEEVHLTLNTVLVPVVDQVKLGFVPGS